MRSLLGALRRVSLTQWIFVGLVLGFVVGVWAPSLVPWVRPFRGLFLNGVKCIIAPLIFGTLVTGIAGTGNARSLGRMGGRAILYFEVVTTLALVIGLIAVNLLQPGAGVDLSHVSADAMKQARDAAQRHVTWADTIEHLLPSNIAAAVVQGDVLQIVIFSTLFALAVLAVGERARPVLAFCDALGQAMFRFTGYIMLLAPIGVGAALAAAVADHGWHIIVPLMKLVGTLYLALAVFLVIVLVPVLRIFRIPIRALFRTVKDPVVLAFTTTSSESALPMALERMEAFGVPRRIGSLVLPLGYSFNLDGSTLYLAVASVFVAQAAGVHLTTGQQVLMMLTLMLTTKGIAAVPRASLVVLTGTLTTFGLPLEGAAIILGVDELMDMARTAVNLLGNCVATALVARWEGITLPATVPATVGGGMEGLAGDAVPVPVVAVEMPRDREV